MPTFTTKSDGKLSQKNKEIAICKKSTDHAHRLIQMAQIRGYDMQKLFSHELTDGSVLFDDQGY